MDCWLLICKYSTLYTHENEAQHFVGFDLVCLSVIDMC